MTKQQTPPADYDKARSLIDREDSICYDIASNYGQIFHNVKHMTWFIKAIAMTVKDH